MANNNRTNYNAMHNSSTPTNKVEEEVTAVNTVEVEEPAEEVIEVTVEPEPEVEESKETFGIVCDCNKLNVRKLPNKAAVVACEVTVGAKLQVDLDKSTLEWYSVRTASGVEGYCMKKFVAVK